jgi:hypothetical protein
MKIIFLSLSRLRSYYKNSNVVFVTFVLGSIVCAITFIYFYGNAMGVKVNHLKNDYEYKHYVINLSEPLDIDINIADIIKNYQPVEIVFRHKLENPVIESEYILYGTEYSNKYDRIGLYMESEINDNRLVFLQKGISNFTKTDVHNPILIPRDILKTEYDFSEININGDLFFVIGQYTSSNLGGFLIPFTLYEKNNYITHQIEINLKIFLSDSQNNEFVTLLSELLPVEYISNPSDLRESDTKAIPINIVYISAIYIICFVSFMFLMKYMTDKNNYENIVYSISGASKKRIVIQILIDNIILSLISSVSGIIIHVLTYDIIFNKINIFDGLLYNGKDYLIVLLFTVVLSEMTAIPFLMKYIKNSIISNKNIYI